MVDFMKPLSSSLRYDGMGSIIATQGSSGPRVMVDAHMDELGGMLSGEQSWLSYAQRRC